MTENYTVVSASLLANLPMYNDIPKHLDLGFNELIHPDSTAPPSTITSTNA